jgi:hypothetical protein
MSNPQDYNQTSPNAMSQDSQSSTGGADPLGGQQQQFDRGTSQPLGSAGTDSDFASQVREHMDVVDAQGQTVGKVDSIDGDRIKLTKNDSPDGQHHYISASDIAGIEGGQIRLSDTGATDYAEQGGDNASFASGNDGQPGGQGSAMSADADSGYSDSTRLEQNAETRNYSSNSGFASGQ